MYVFYTCHEYLMYIINMTDRKTLFYSKTKKLYHEKRSFLTTSGVVDEPTNN